MSALIKVASHDRHLLSFTNLAELHVLDALRRVHQIQMKKVKDVDWLAEAQALIAAGLRVFVVTATDLTGDEPAQVLVDALPRIRRLCARHRPPFIAGITRTSEVTLLTFRS